MWTFNRVRVSIVAAVALLAGGIDCGGPTSDCLRFSDCSPGLTCAAGKCVAPPPSAPSGDGSLEDDGSTDGDGSGEAAPDLTDAGGVEAQTSTGEATEGGDAPAE